MVERRKQMQGSIDNFFKVFDEVRRIYANVDFKLNYTKFYRMEISVDGKTIFDLRGNETNMLFDNAASKLLSFLRSDKEK